MPPRLSAASRARIRQIKSDIQRNAAARARDRQRRKLVRSECHAIRKRTYKEAIAHARQAARARVNAEFKTCLYRPRADPIG